MSGGASGPFGPTLGPEQPTWRVDMVGEAALDAALRELAAVRAERDRLVAEVAPLRGLRLLAEELVDAKGGGEVHAVINRITAHLDTLGQPATATVDEGGA
jgi:hypothetical protein